MANYYGNIFLEIKKIQIGGKKYDNIKGGNPWGGISLDKERGIVYNNWKSIKLF